jgi:hypothetical protein
MQLCWVLFLAGLCTGCMSAQERSAAIANTDDRACQAYGAAPGSQEYFQCRMMKDQQRQNANAAAAQMLLSRPQPTPYMLPVPQRY